MTMPGDRSKMPTVAELLAAFESAVLPFEDPELRKTVAVAFYGGFASALGAVQDELGLVDGDASRLERARARIATFMVEMLRYSAAQAHLEKKDAAPAHLEKKDAD